jgi:hypothetical protein
MTILGLLVLIVVIGVAFWAVKALSAAFGIPEPIRTVIIVLLVIVALVIVLQSFGLADMGLRLSR